MKDQIINILSQKIKKELVKDLVNSYEKVKDEFIKGNPEEAQSKSGKFVENVFRVLHFIRTDQVLTEMKSGQMNDISKKLLNADSKKFSESIRILIPRIAQAMIYEPRSKMGSVHVKSVEPDFIDAKLTVDAADWIVAEFLRQYDARDADKVNALIKNVVKEYVPVIQKVGDETFVNAKVDCEEEILIRLNVANDGLTRTELGQAMKTHFKAPTISNALKKMVKNRDIHPTNEGKYVISDPARKKISSRIIELSRL